MRMYNSLKHRYQSLVTLLGAENARLEAKWMVEKLLEQSSSQLTPTDQIRLQANPDEFFDTLPQNHRATLARWFNERVHERKPLQYILGDVPFCGLTIRTRPPILIPRPETEEWTAWLIDQIAQYHKHLSNQQQQAAAKSLQQLQVSQSKHGIKKKRKKAKLKHVNVETTSSSVAASSVAASSVATASESLPTSPNSSLSSDSSPSSPPHDNSSTHSLNSTSHNLAQTSASNSVSNSSTASLTEPSSPSSFSSSSSSSNSSSSGNPFLSFLDYLWDGLKWLRLARQSQIRRWKKDPPSITNDTSSHQQESFSKPLVCPWPSASSPTTTATTTTSSSSSHSSASLSSLPSSSSIGSTSNTSPLTSSSNMSSLYSHSYDNDYNDEDEIDGEEIADDEKPSVLSSVSSSLPSASDSFPLWIQNLTSDHFSSSPSSSSSSLALGPGLPAQHTALRILDLCTGSGNIALSLARNLSHSMVIGMDRNPDAVFLANENLTLNLVSNCQFVVQDVTTIGAFDSLRRNYGWPWTDLIVSNPPYIPADRWPTLQPEIQLWEDPNALVCPDQGLALYSAIIRAAPFILRPLHFIHPYHKIQSLNTNSNASATTSPSEIGVPELVLELGEAWQADVVGHMLTKAGFVYNVHHDLSDRVRWISAKRLAVLQLQQQ